MKTTNNKKDFIEVLSSMSDVEINEYIKMHGKGPKPVVMCRYINKVKNNDSDKRA